MDLLPTSLGGPAAQAVPGPSLEPAEETALAPGLPRYCPSGLLATFSLLMAGHGRCVNAGMMLGDREYALWQLACARALEGDAELAEVARRLFAYFDDPQR